MQERSTPRNRYPGVKPFNTEEREAFFGRERETEELFRLMYVKQVVVLYAKSGFGKSSLLNAGIIPKLLDDSAYHPLTIRFTNRSTQEADTGLHPIDTLKIRLQNELDVSLPSPVSQLTNDDNSLWHWLKTWQNLHSNKGLILLFDQFEELFTYSPEAISTFSEELAEVLYSPIPLKYRRRLAELSKTKQLDAAFHDFLYQKPDLKIVFSIRTDRLALLNQLTDRHPAILQHCYELMPLRADQAEAALTQPAALPATDYDSPPFDYAPEAIQAILDSILKNGQVEATSVLQIVGRHIESEIVLSQGKTFITDRQLGPVTDIIQNYYFNNGDEIINEKSKINDILTKSEERERYHIINLADSEKKVAIENLQIDIEKVSNDIINKLSTYVSSMCTIYKNYGEVHGKVNFREYNIRSTAKGEASIMTENIESLIDGSIKGIQYQINTLEKKKKMLEEEMSICQRHRNHILDYSNENARQFSSWRAFVYIFFGILLLLIFIPLSSSIIKGSTSEKEISFIEILSNPKTLSFSFGVAFCTILFKTLYDDYINFRDDYVDFRLDSLILRLIKFENDKKKVRNIEMGIKLINLISLLIILYHLGISKKTSLSDGADDVYFISFMLITIIIPAISGICLSIGLNNLSNITTVEKSIENLEKIHRQYEVISEDIVKLVVKISRLEVFQKEWNNTEHKVNAISEQLTVSYIQGLKNSYLKEFGYDLYPNPLGQ